eukprot:gene51647-63142_t
MHWQTTRFDIDLTTPQVMGIVNVTPDSFSDGGQHDDTRTAIAHCERLVAEGAGILDIGGESTRPGAPRVDADSEWARIADVLAAAVTLGVPVSVDTYKPEVMRQALDLGADIINDIWALRQDGAREVVATVAVKRSTASCTGLAAQREPANQPVACLSRPIARFIS